MYFPFLPSLPFLPFLSLPLIPFPPYPLFLPCSLYLQFLISITPFFLNFPPFFPPPSSLLPQAMTVVLRDFKRHEISEDELKLLLSFVEEDIHDYQRQSTAFPLLKVVGHNIMYC